MYRHHTLFVNLTRVRALLLLHLLTTHHTHKVSMNVFLEMLYKVSLTHTHTHTHTHTAHTHYTWLRKYSHARAKEKERLSLKSHAMWFTKERTRHTHTHTHTHNWESIRTRARRKSTQRDCSGNATRARARKLWSEEKHIETTIKLSEHTITIAIIQNITLKFVFETLHARVLCIYEPHTTRRRTTNSSNDDETFVCCFVWWEGNNKHKLFHSYYGCCYCFEIVNVLFYMSCSHREFSKKVYSTEVRKCVFNIMQTDSAVWNGENPSIAFWRQQWQQHWTTRRTKSSTFVSIFCWASREESTQECLGNFVNIVRDDCV